MLSWLSVQTGWKSVFSRVNCPLFIVVVAGRSFLQCLRLAFLIPVSGWQVHLSSRWNPAGEMERMFGTPMKLVHAAPEEIRRRGKKPPAGQHSHHLYALSLILTDGSSGWWCATRVPACQISSNLRVPWFRRQWLRDIIRRSDRLIIPTAWQAG